MSDLETRTTLTFTLTEQDVRRYYTDCCEYHRSTDPRWRRREKAYHYRHYLSAIMIPGIVSVSVYSLTEQMGLFFVALVFSAILWQWAQAKAQEKQRRRYLQRLCDVPGFVGTHCVKINTEGFSNRTSYSAWTIFWPYVHDIFVGKHCLLFVTGDPKHPRISPVPLSAFANQEEARQFVERAGAFWKDAPKGNA